MLMPGKNTIREITVYQLVFGFCDERRIMFTIYAILLFAFIALVFGVIFALIGWRGGLFSGIRIFAFSVVAVLLAFFVSPLISKAIYSSKFSGNTVTSVTDKAAELGVGGTTFSRIVDNTIQRYISMVIGPVLFLLILGIIGISWLIIRENINRGKEQKSVQKKAAGLILGIAAAVFITVFSAFAPKINLVKEAGRASNLFDDMKSVIAGNIDFKDFMTDSPKLLDFYFSTQLIAADEEERVELIYDVIVDLTKAKNNKTMRDIVASLKFNDREALEREIKGIIEVVDCFGDEFIQGILDGNISKAVANIPDINTAVDKLYTLSIRDSVVKSVMTMVVRTILDDKTYIYPDTIEINGTEASFTELLKLIPKLLGDKTEAFRHLDEIKNSPLLPSEVFDKIMEYQILDIIE